VSQHRELDSVLAEHWWAAVAAIARRTGDLEVAEDAVQEACAAAVAQWPGAGLPPNPRAWLITTAWYKAVDSMRRETRRSELEAETGLGAAESSSPASAGAAWSGAAWSGAGPSGAGPTGAAWSGAGPAADDELALICACCHPALDLAARIALTLRCVCGLPTAEIAAVFVVPEPTIAQRIVRAKRKIRQAGIALTVPRPEDLADRLGTVLRVVYLVYAQGHRAASGAELVRAELCDRAVWLARQLAGVLPGEPEITGLLALLLLTDARRATRTGPDGELVLLADQDRGQWDPAKITEGEALITSALRQGRPGPYQLHAAIAACHSTAESAEATDWPQIAALYSELSRFEPTPVVIANQAVAVAMAQGPSAGLAMLDRLADDGRLDRWPPLHVARAELLARLGRCEAARDAYQAALAAAELPAAERDFIGRRIADLTAT
jgi:RNA polymerase sigma-70 factor (ECF subfamily)